MRSAFRVVVVCLSTVLAIAATLIAVYLAVTEDVDNLWPLSWLGFLVVGGFLVAKRPENRVSWTVAGIGILLSLAPIGELGSFRLGEGPGLVLALLTNLTVAGFVLIPLLLLWYPTGAVPSPRWIWVERVLQTLGALLVAYYVIRPGLLGVTDFENPFGLGLLAPLRDSAVEQAAGELVVVLGILAFFSLVMRWRRGEGLERQQIKLAALAGFFLLGLIGLSFILEGVMGTESRAVDVIQVLAFVGGFNALAVAIAVAVVRYRLYEIDRIVSRIVSYAALVAVLAGVFFGAVTLFTSVLESESDLVTAAATLLVAGLFNPVRKKLQLWVDRRFNRSRYDAQQVMGRFAGAMQGEVDPDEVVAGWVSVVSSTMAPKTVGVWISQESRNDFGTVRG